MPYPPDDSAESSRRPPPSNAPTFYAKRRGADKQDTTFQGDLAYELLFHDYALILNAQTLQAFHFSYAYLTTKQKSRLSAQ